MEGDEGEAGSWKPSSHHTSGSWRLADACMHASLALCMEHAKGTAGMVLHAAAAMAEKRAGQRHDGRAGRLDSCFRDDVANAREPVQFQRPLSAEELGAARSAVGIGGLADVFSGDMAAARVVPELDDGGVVDGAAAVAGLFAAGELLNDDGGGAGAEPNQEFAEEGDQSWGIRANPHSIW